MSYLTSAQYIALTGLPLTGVNVAYLDFKLKFWSSQISKYTGQNFGSVINTQTKIFNVLSCGDSSLNIGGWQKAGLVVSVKVKGRTNWQVLVENTDFVFVYPHFDTFVDGVLQAKPVIGIDFSCLSCRCSCEEIKIEGDNRWSIGLPDDLMLLLTDLVALLLQYDPNAYSAGILPNNQLMKQVKSEEDQTRRISWQRDDKANQLANQKLTSGINVSNNTSLLSMYFDYNLNHNCKFYG